MRILIGTLAIALLAGCATSPLPAEKADPVPSSRLFAYQVPLSGQGTLLITRDKGLVGIGLGIETNAEGVLQSQFLVSADRFAVVGALAGGEVFTPFLVENGQVFMGSAFIQDGTITNAKIGEYIASTNYVAGISGWRLDKSGTFEINGSVPGEGRMIMTHRSLRVYDAANAKRVQLGDLTE